MNAFLTGWLIGTVLGNGLVLLSMRRARKRRRAEADAFWAAYWKRRAEEDRVQAVSNQGHQV